jgi:hypothetical protein
MQRVFNFPLSHHLSPSTRFREHFPEPGDRFAFPFAQLEDLDLPASGTRKIVPSLACDNRIKHLSALIAANRHSHREAQGQIFHSVGVA